MKLFWKIVLLDFALSFVIALTTLAFVSKSYAKTFLAEILFVTVWFAYQKTLIEEKRAKEWTYGYPAYLLGGVSGALIGLWVSK